MIDRSKYFPISTILVGLFVLSIGLNIVLFNKVNKLISEINTINSPISNNDLKELMKETKRLSQQNYTSDNDPNIKYDLKTRKPIKNDF